MKTWITNRLPVRSFASVSALGMLMLALVGSTSEIAIAGGAFRPMYQEVTITKHCGRCGHAVSERSLAWQQCPYCGAFWGYESRSVRRHTRPVLKKRQTHRRRETRAPSIRRFSKTGKGWKEHGFYPVATANCHSLPPLQTLPLFQPVPIGNGNTSFQ